MGGAPLQEAAAVPPAAQRRQPQVTFVHAAKRAAPAQVLASGPQAAATAERAPSLSLVTEPEAVRAAGMAAALPAAPGAALAAGMAARSAAAPPGVRR